LGWEARIAYEPDDDDPAEVVVFCPICAVREFEQFRVPWWRERRAPWVRFSAWAWTEKRGRPRSRACACKRVDMEALPQSHSKSALLRALDEVLSDPAGRRRAKIVGEDEEPPCP
jgi:hypothetical protein